MNLDIAWLASAEGQLLIAQARSVRATATDIDRLRRANPHLDVELIGSALHQAWLGQRAAARWGTETQFLLTTDGLAQATRPAVSQFHAQWVTENISPLAHVVDLTCGLGFDAYAFAQAGHRVTAIERDPEIAALAQHNLRNLDVTVLHADAVEYEIPRDADVIFVDPARRDPDAAKTAEGNTVRSLNPHTWSPSWSFVKSLAHTHRVMAKVAPGIDDSAIGDWDAAFVSCDRDLVEAMVTSHGSAARSAVLLENGHSEVIPGSDTASPSPIGQYLVVPDPALTRARALGWLSHVVDGGLVNEHIGWITTSNIDAIVALEQRSPRLAMVVKIEADIAYSPKTIKRAVAEHSPSSVTIMTRGVKLDVEAVRRQLSSTFVSSGDELVIAIFRDDNGTRALLCRRLT